MNLDSALALLAKDATASLDVAELALRLACDEYPDLDVEAYLGEVNAMAREARSYVGGDLETRVHGLCRYLFHEMGFHGNTQHYYDPGNSYFHLVLDRRTGIPISLSTLVMAVGARVGLEVAGVGLPGHFIVKALAPGREVLFDPFHGGRILTPAECENLVRQVTGREDFQPGPQTLGALPLGLMIFRMLNNLRGIYLAAQDIPRTIRVMERMVQVYTGNPALRRDLGTCLLRTGKPGKAIDHLAAYLSAFPEAEDAPEVRRRLQEARNDLAAWN